METFRIADNRIFQADGNDFVFLAETSAIFEMEPGIREALEAGRLMKEFSLDTFCEALDGPAEEKEALCTGLVENRVLVNTGIDVYGYGSVGANIPLKTMVLHVTDECNLGCLYCYYATEAEREKKRPSMASGVAEQAVDFLFEQSRGLDEVVLVFFGGEPLMNFDLISSTTAYARKRARETGKKIDFAITTNGTLLSDRTIDFLHENGVGITVSIDGYAEIHDRYRCFPGGAPSYDVILPKLRKLLENNRKKPVVARVTVAGESENIPGILDHLLGLGFSEAGFAPVTTCDASFQLNSESMERLLEQFRLLASHFIEYAQRDDFLGFTNLIDMLVVLHEGEIKNYPCGAGQGLFSVDTEGRLYPCQRLTGDADLFMGDIFKGFERKRISEFRSSTEIGQKKICTSCWVRNICAGGCYHEAQIREGGFSKPNRHYCRWIKRWVETGLEVYGTLMNSCPDYLDKLSMLRGHEPLLNQIV